MKSAKDREQEMERKAKEEVDAEMARLEKSWQCSRLLSAFAHQCWTGLMRLLPKTWQIRHRHKIAKVQLLRNEQNNQTEEKEKKTDEKTKTATKQAKSKQPAGNDRREKIGEDRIQQAKFEWLKECQRIMHQGSFAAEEGMKIHLKSRADRNTAAKDNTQTSFADTTDNKEKKEWLDEFVKHHLIKPDGPGAKACDTLDVCTVAFFIQAVRRSRADSGGELAFSPIWQAIREATRTRLAGDDSAPFWAAGAPTKPSKAAKGKTENEETMTRAEPVPPATQTDIQELSFWLAEQLVSHAFEVCFYYRRKELVSSLFPGCSSKMIEQIKKEEVIREWSFQQDKKLRAMAANLNFILKSEKFQSCNVHQVFQVSCPATNNSCLSSSHH